MGKFLLSVGVMCAADFQGWECRLGRNWRPRVRCASVDRFRRGTKCILHGLVVVLAECMAISSMRREFFGVLQALCGQMHCGAVQVPESLQVLILERAWPASQPCGFVAWWLGSSVADNDYKRRPRSALEILSNFGKDDASRSAGPVATRAGRADTGRCCAGVSLSSVSAVDMHRAPCQTQDVFACHAYHSDGRLRPAEGVSRRRALQAGREMCDAPIGSAAPPCPMTSPVVNEVLNSVASPFTQRAFSRPALH
jgi:hypothetical protein